MTKALLLVNLGSPEAPDEESLKRYLNEFLMDRYVIDTPWPIRRFVLSAFILPRRPAQSAAAYRSIWTDEGSPLIAHTQALANALAVRVDMPLTWAMRYGDPSIEDALSTLAAIPGVDTIGLVPHNLHGILIFDINQAVGPHLFAHFETTVTGSG